MSVSTVYTDNIAIGNSDFSITGIDVPNDADIAILIVKGYVGTATEDFVDVSNFDGDSDDHFVHQVTGLDPDDVCVGLWMLKYGETGFPTRGATGITLDVSLIGNLIYGGGFAEVFFLSGFETDGTEVIGTDSVDGDTGGWTCNSLGSVGPSDIGIIAAVGYANAVESTPTGSGQTELAEGNESTMYHASAYELGEDQLSVDYPSGSYMGAVAIAISASAGGGSLDIPIATHHYTKNLG